MQVPDSITSWVGEAVGLSPRRGLGIAEPTLLKTFKPFFVDFMLPPYVVRGEQAKTPLSIYNYLDTCAEVPEPPSIYSLSCCQLVGRRGGGEGAASLMSGGRESCGPLEGDGLEGHSTCDVG